MMADSGAIWTAGPAASPGAGRGWSWVEPTIVERSVMVTPDEWRVAAACHGPTSPQQLAVRTGMEPEHLQRVVETMAELGLLRLVEEQGGAASVVAPRALGIVPEPAAAEVAAPPAPPVPSAPSAPPAAPAPEIPAPSPLVFEAPGSTSGRPPRHAPAAAGAATAAPPARPRPRPEVGGPKLSSFERRVAKLEQRAQRVDGDEDGLAQP